ncbi:MAG: ester cyclase [Eudoraea sp.]
MKTKYLPFIALILLNFGCKNSSQKSESNSIQIDANTENTMEQKSLIDFGNEYASAWSSQKPERVADFFATDASLTVNDGKPAVGTEAIINVAKGFMDAFPDMIVSMDSLVTKSNKTRFYWTLTGTNNVPGGTGNKVKISGYEEWTMNKEGLVQESKGHFNAEEYNRQLNGEVTE